ncbi:unnamed protein product [Camellia sinensis]
MRYWVIYYGGEYDGRRGCDGVDRLWWRKAMGCMWLAAAACGGHSGESCGESLIYVSHQDGFYDNIHNKTSTTKTTQVMDSLSDEETANSGTSSYSTEDSINLGDSNASDENYGELERSPGMKAEKDGLNKRKTEDCGNEGTGSALVRLLEDILKERKKMNEKKIEMFERSYLLEEEKLGYKKEKLQMKKRKMEERIVFMDTSGMLPLQAEYFQRRQMEILGKKI